jgi:hypothetical protein
MYRFIMSRSHSASGCGESSLGRSSDPRRAPEARHQRLRTHGVALFARPTDGTVTEVAHIPRQPLRPARVHLADGVIVRGGPSPRHRHLPLVVPPSAVVKRWGVRLHSTDRCRLASFAPRHVSWFAPGPRSRSRPNRHAATRRPRPATVCVVATGLMRTGLDSSRPCVHRASPTNKPVRQFARRPAGSPSRVSLCAIELSMCRKVETSSFGRGNAHLRGESRGRRNIGEAQAVRTSSMPICCKVLRGSGPYTASRSRMTNRGAVSHGHASRSCCAVHAASDAP